MQLAKGVGRYTGAWKFLIHRPDLHVCISFLSVSIKHCKRMVVKNQ